MSGQTERLSVKRGYATSRDEGEAIRELSKMIAQPDPSVVVLFASSTYDLERLSAEAREVFAGPVIGCTTSGEISPLGYSENSLSGFSIATDELEVHPYLITPLRQFDPAQIEAVAKSVHQRLAHAKKERPDAAAFGLLLIDGLSIMEEQVVAMLASMVGDMPLVGGSAGDDLKLEETHVYHEGRFLSDAALFCLFITTLPFEPIKTQHFTATDKRMVITRAEPERRVVQEINGRPAAEEYARLIGHEVDQLDPMAFSSHPVMLRLGGEYYVRSIQRVNEDGSLTFFCAIDEGLVLRVAEGRNLVENLEQAFGQVSQTIPRVKLTIGFDCVLRRLEVINSGLQEQVGEILKQNNVSGFHTYGEQFNAVHVNQTFTGIVLGESDDV